LNDLPNSEAMKILTTKSANEAQRLIVMQNAKEISKHRHHGPTTTFTDWNIKSSQPEVIDYIFIWQGFGYDVVVDQHGVLADFWDDFFPPSDHRPVVADLIISKQ
jgi:hypothetical protein